jgi:hypothetical protein
MKINDIASTEMEVANWLGIIPKQGDKPIIRRIKITISAIIASGIVVVEVATKSPIDSRPAFVR